MDLFDRVREALVAGDTKAGFALAIERFRAEGSYPLIFEARLMQERHALGMPLIQTETWNGLSESCQAAYERATVEAAREVGALFLEDGEIARAWPYFRAIGEKDRIRQAIEECGDAAPGEALDGIVEVAYHEQVNPKKGLRADPQALRHLSRDHQLFAVPGRGRPGRLRRNAGRERPLRTAGEHQARRGAEGGPGAGRRRSGCNLGTPRLALRGECVLLGHLACCVAGADGPFARARAHFGAAARLGALRMPAQRNAPVSG